jgi:uncharacterized protein involved in exopolysaccharide biosynthesis
MDKSMGSETTSEFTEIDLRKIFGRMWRHRLRLALIMAVFAVLGVGISFLVPSRYTAEATLIPQTPSQNVGLLGRLASLTSAGVDLEGSNEGLYGQILHSDLFLNKLVRRSWGIGVHSDSMTLASAFGMDFENKEPFARAVEVEKLKRVLRRNCIRFNRDPATGFMKVKVTVPFSPELAAAVTNFLVAELDIYNIDIKTRRAREHRNFVAESLKDVAIELEIAEAALLEFVVSNTAYSASPALMRRYGGYEREVMAQRSIWLQLRSELETAKIEEHKELASINILDMATAPVKRSSPDRVLYLLAGSGAGLLLALLSLVWGISFRSRNKT